MHVRSLQNHKHHLLSAVLIPYQAGISQNYTILFIYSFVRHCASVTGNWYAYISNSILMMEFQAKNSISFVKISTLIVGICNVYFIGAEYQVEEKLDLAYFIIVVLLFVLTLLWALAILLLGIQPEACLPAEIGFYIVAGILYLAGVICFIVAYTKEDASDDFPGGKIISSVLGFLSVILYLSGSLLIFLYIKHDTKDGSGA